MRRSRFSEEQIVGILKEQEAGVPIAELARRHGVSDQTLSWKKKYGGLDISDAKAAQTTRGDPRGGVLTCYLVVALANGTPLSHSDALCSLPAPFF